MKKMFGKVCYAIGGTLISTFALGVISGMVMSPCTDVNIKDRSDKPE